MSRSRTHHSRTRNRGVIVRTKMTTHVCMFSYLQNTPNWKAWQYRTLSQQKAEELEKEGKAERIIREDVDGVVKTVGWRMKEPLRAERPSPCTLTMGTMHAVARKALGYTLSRGDRQHIAKFIAWPLVGDTKAVAVRPRQTDAERLRAESLLGYHGPEAQRATESLLAICTAPAMAASA